MTHWLASPRLPRLRLRQSLAAALGMSVALAGANAGDDPPANDNCVSAFPVLAGVFTGTTVFASNDGRACGISQSTPDVWYSFTATGNGTLNVDTCGSDYDTVLSIHSGCPGNSGNQLVYNDDACGNTGLNSRVSLPVTSGTTYLIRVSGFNGNTGNYTLNVNPNVTPTNDTCQFAIPVGAGTYSASTAGFNTDGSAACASSAADAWWSYTATGNGTLNLDTCGSNFDTVLSVHTACPGTADNQLACDDDACGFAAGSRVSVQVTMGTTYLIRVAAFGGSSGGNVLLVVNPVVTPGNDDCADAFDVGPGTYTGSTATATTDGSSNCSAGTTARDVWYRYTAPGFGTLGLDTCGSSFDTVLSVHSGCPGTAGNILACNDDSFTCGFLSTESALFLPVTQGATYLIRVAGFDSASGGSFVLHVNPSVVASNDACAFAYPVGQGTFTGSTAGATRDGSISCAFSNATPDVWYAYTAPAPGTLNVDTCGSAYDTVLSVHSGCPGNADNTIACNDDSSCGRQSSLSVPVTQGATYLIRISGFGGSVGNYTLNISQTYLAPANNDCASAVTIGNGVTAFTNLGATTDGPSDGSCSPFGNLTVGSDLWYLYTPLCTGTVTVSTCGSDFDTMIAVYPNTNCPNAPNIAIACNDDSCGLQSNVAFGSVAGMTYLIRVGGFFGDQGTGIITIGCTGPTCPADYNQDGVLNSDDLSDFITGYFNVPADPATDFNADGVINADDLGDFITAYFNGCP